MEQELLPPGSPLFTRPSRARSRRNAIMAHARRKNVAREVGRLVADLRAKKCGPPTANHELERLSLKASRLAGKAGMHRMPRPKRKKA